MKLIIKPVGENEDYMEFRDDIYIRVSRRVLGKVEKHPRNKYYIGNLTTNGEIFSVYPEIDPLDAMHILKLARDEVREEIKSEQRYEEHKQLEKEFAALPLEEKQRLLSHD